MESLSARLFKAWYYPFGNVFDTVFTDEVSQTWKVIDFDLELVKKGAIYGISNENFVGVWRDS